MDQPTITERIQQGTITVTVGGELRQVPAELKIIETVYPDGRKDVTVKVPRLSAKPKLKQGA
jgi:hypothetical protein